MRRRSRRSSRSRTRRRSAEYTSWSLTTGHDYVGQTVNIVSRYSAHKRCHGDVAAFSFAPCEPALLDYYERAVIRNEQRTHPLRNLMLTDWPGTHHGIHCRRHNQISPPRQAPPGVSGQPRIHRYSDTPDRAGSTGSCFAVNRPGGRNPGRRWLSRYPIVPFRCCGLSVARRPSCRPPS